MKSAQLHDMELYIAKNSVSSLEELSAHYNVSISTIRRDISELAHQKKLTKIYGGVMTKQQAEEGTLLAEKPLPEDDKRQKIGQLAASLVQDGMSIFLDSGYTTLQILPNIAHKKNITVISHSLTALCEAAKYPSLRIIALGGVYNSTSASFQGGNTLNELSKMSIDIVFLATTGATLELGLTNSFCSDVEIKKSVIKWNKNIVLMADHSKFGRNALLSFCDYQDISVIVTDQPLDGDYMRANALKQIQVITPQTMEAATAANLNRRSLDGNLDERERSIS